MSPDENLVILLSKNHLSRILKFGIHMSSTIHWACQILDSAGEIGATKR